MNGKRVEFQPPGQFDFEAYAAGDEIALHCTFTVKQNGLLCLTRFGDFPMPGYENPEPRRNHWAAETQTEW